MSKKIVYKVIKAPSKTKTNIDYEQRFPQLPTLYLELIENRLKVKPEKLGKDYIPEEAQDVDIIKVSSEPHVVSSKNVNAKPNPISSFMTDRSRGDRSSLSASSVSSLSDNSEDIDVVLSDSDASCIDVPVYSSDDDKNSIDSTHSTASTIISTYTQDNALSNHLTNILERDKSKKSRQTDQSRLKPSKQRRSDDFDGFKQPRHKFEDDIKQSPEPHTERNDFSEQPRLSQLQQTSSGPANINTDEEDEDLKREYLFKFELLKKQFKDRDSGISIPEFSIHTDLKTMQKSYESVLKHLSLDSTVEDYKKYLIGFFIFIEFLFGKVFKFDMEGFTKQQILSMNSYERLLLELGEKSYVPGESKWPVEMRLIGLVVINTAVFLFMKFAASKASGGFLGLLNMFSQHTNKAKSYSAPQSGGNSGQDDVKKRKMKGPNINFDDIPDITEET